MTDRDRRLEQQQRLVKIAFGMTALVCLLTGLVLYLFAENFGFDPETARYVAIAFLVVGVGDYLVLRFWDRIRRRGDSG